MRHPSSSLHPPFVHLVVQAIIPRCGAADSIAHRLAMPKAMAKDVHATLVRAYADVKSLSPEAAEQAVARLERDKRYLQDTY
jgi:hypothetical protein